MIDERNRRLLKEALVEPFGPPSPNLERTALASLERSRVRRAVTRILAVAAVLAFIGLAASIALAAHLFRDNSGPAGLSSAQIARELAQLRQRPLDLPALGPNGTCPETPQPAKSVFFRKGQYQTIGGPVFGNHGPIYGWGGPETTGAHGYYFNVTWLSDASYRGLALVRGRRLDGTQQLVFAGPLAAGSLVTTDTIEGKATRLFDELVLPSSSPSSSVWRQWPVLQGVPGGGCYGFQLDGPSFHDTFVVLVLVPQGG